MNVNEIIFIRIKREERKVGQPGLSGLGVKKRRLESKGLLLERQGQTRQQIASYSLRRHP